MGIVNVTPDSFADGGQFLDSDKALKRIEELIDQGADIIDIGAESSRPGAQSISITEELGRLEPVISKYGHYFSKPLSIDTIKPEVAEWGLSQNMSLLNSILPVHKNIDMMNVLKDKQIDVVLMHIQGTPETMQTAPKYNDIIHELFGYFNEGIQAIESMVLGKVIIDPGIGFGKTVNDNLYLLKHITAFNELKRSIMIGVSNKSFIGKISNADVDDRLAGTLISQIWAIQNGVEIIRCHDVKQMHQALKVYEAIMEGSE